MLALPAETSPPTYMKNRDHTANDVRIFQSAHPALQMAFTDVLQTGEKENHREQQKNDA